MAGLRSWLPGVGYEAGKRVKVGWRYGQCWPGTLGREPRHRGQGRSKRDEVGEQGVARW